MKEFITDNNEFLADGVTPNPDCGKTIEIDHPDEPKPQPVPPTTKQQILDQIAVLQTIASKLP